MSYRRNRNNEWKEATSEYSDLARAVFDTVSKHGSGAGKDIAKRVMDSIRDSMTGKRRNPFDISEKQRWVVAYNYMNYWKNKK